MELGMRRLHTLFAAEVVDVDLRQAPGPALCAAIHDAMNQHAVVVLRDQNIDDEQEMAFARALGPLEPMPAQVGMDKQRLKHREMVDISNLART